MSSGADPTEENSGEVQGDVVVGVVECSERGFLMVRRSENETMTGRWEFPGGIVEKTDEDLEEAVLREVEEEASIQAEIVDDGEPFIGEGSTGYWHLHPFLLRTDSYEEVDLSHEHDTHKWIEIEELDSLETVGRMEAVDRLGLNRDS